MVEIFNYTNRVVNMVRPRKLLVMAIGASQIFSAFTCSHTAATRRWCRTTCEDEPTTLSTIPCRTGGEGKGRETTGRHQGMGRCVISTHKSFLVRLCSDYMFIAMGMKVTEEERKKEAWDSNAITPGTPFMDLLAQSLRYWVVEKMNSDPGWKNLEVIISDASVPGEGEHKIMDFIRRQRSNPGYDPNTHHVIYGLVCIISLLPYKCITYNFVFYRMLILSCCHLLRMNRISVYFVKTYFSKILNRMPVVYANKRVILPLSVKASPSRKQMSTTPSQ